MSHINDTIQHFLLENGASLAGFADLASLPGQQTKGYPYGIIFGIATPPHIVTKLYHNPGSDCQNASAEIGRKLSDLAEKTAAWLNGIGYLSFPLTQQNVKVDPDTGRTELPYKTIATKAGIGWIGKSSLLITEQFGPAIRFSAVLTHAKLQVGEPVKRSRCGECNKCQALCPSQTIKGKLWDESVDRDEIMNPAACRAKNVERAKALGLTGGICGLCVYACPYTQRYVNKALG